MVIMNGWVLGVINRANGVVYLKISGTRVVQGEIRFSKAKVQFADRHQLGKQASAFGYLLLPLLHEGAVAAAASFTFLFV